MATLVYGIAKQLTEEWAGQLLPSLKAGDRVKSADGRQVEIASGQFWGTRGVSNHWEWREVLPDGSLSSILENGYGNFSSL